MHRRPTREQVRTHDASSSSSSNTTFDRGSDGAAMAAKAAAAAVRLRVLRLIFFVALVLIAFNILVGCMVAVRDALRYGVFTRLHFAWIMQCVLIVYVVTAGASNIHTALRSLIPNHVMAVHHRKIILLTFLKALTIIGITLFAIVSRLLAHWSSSSSSSSTRDTRRRGVFLPVLFSLHTVCGWQVILFCTLIICLVLADYYDLIFPSPTQTQPRSTALLDNKNNNNNTTTTTGSVPSSLVATAMATGTAVIPTTAVTSKAPTTYYYYYCPLSCLSHRRILERLAYKQPAYLLLALCPLSAREVRCFVGTMRTRKEYDFALTPLHALFNDRTLRLIRRTMIAHVEGVERAEVALGALDAGDNQFLEREIVCMLQTQSRQLSKGIDRDLAELFSAKCLQARTRDELERDAHALDLRRQVAGAFFRRLSK